MSVKRRITASIGSFVLCWGSFHAIDVSAAPASAVHNVVSDEQGALAVAYALMFALHPNLRARMASEQRWIAAMRATLHDGIWVVSSKTGEIAASPNQYIYISQDDGRLLDVHYTQ